MKRQVDPRKNYDFDVSISGGKRIFGILSLNQIIERTKKYDISSYIEARIVYKCGNYSDPVAYRDKDGWTLLEIDMEENGQIVKEKRHE